MGNADFLDVYFAGDLHRKCVFCGSVFRAGDQEGTVWYNHHQLCHCPFCAAYAAQPALPEWVKQYSRQVSIKNVRWP